MPDIGLTAVPGQPQLQPRPHSADEVLMQDVTNATKLELADSSPSELVGQVNEDARQPCCCHW